MHTHLVSKGRQSLFKIVDGDGYSRHCSDHGPVLSRLSEPKPLVVTLAESTEAVMKTQTIEDHRKG